MKQPLQDSIPERVIHDIPTYEMPEPQSCIPTVLRSVVNFFEPERQMTPTEADIATNRMPGQRGDLNAFCMSLLESGYAVSVKTAWDEKRFLKEEQDGGGLAYARSFYRMDTKAPLASEELFAWHFRDIAALRASSLVQYEIYAQYTTYSETAGTPTYSDLLSHVAMGSLACIQLRGSDAGHFAIVNGYETNPNEDIIHPSYFSPHVGYNEGAFVSDRGEFLSKWIATEGIIAISRLSSSRTA